mmetsp:Transcript_1225/g.3514  ORF Transcript_1225/g.3514 Transcript_1225/m.3514 type:complete len:285 (+) Transcript_1225:142-996(+)
MSSCFRGGCGCPRRSGRRTLRRRTTSGPRPRTWWRPSRPLSEMAPSSRAPRRASSEARCRRWKPNETKRFTPSRSRPFFRSEICRNARRSTRSRGKRWRWRLRSERRRKSPWNRTPNAKLRTSTSEPSPSIRSSATSPPSSATSRRKSIPSSPRFPQRCPARTRPKDNSFPRTTKSKPKCGAASTSPSACLSSWSSSSSASSASKTSPAPPYSSRSFFSCCVASFLPLFWLLLGVFLSRVVSTPPPPSRKDSSAAHRALLELLRLLPPFRSFFLCRQEPIVVGE